MPRARKKEDRLLLPARSALGRAAEAALRFWNQKVWQPELFKARNVTLDNGCRAHSCEKRIENVTQTDMGATSGTASDINTRVPRNGSWFSSA